MIVYMSSIDDKQQISKQYKQGD